MKTKTLTVYQVSVSWIDTAQDFETDHYYVAHNNLFANKGEAEKLADLEFEKVLELAKDYTNNFLEIDKKDRSIEYENYRGDTANIQVFVEPFIVKF